MNQGSIPTMARFHWLDPTKPDAGKLHVLALDADAPNLRRQWWKRAILLVIKLLRAVRLVNGKEAPQRLLSADEETLIQMQMRRSRCTAQSVHDVIEEVHLSKEQKEASCK